MPAEFIPNIEKTAAEKLKELAIKPLKSLGEFKRKDKRFYTTPCQTKNHKTVLFKILISNKKKDAASLQKEIALSEMLNKAAQDKPALNTIPLIKAEATKYPYWLLREYVPGRRLGYNFKIYKLGLKKGVVEKIVESLLAVQAIPWQKNKAAISRIPLKEKTAQGYLDNIKYFEKVIKLKNKTNEVDFRAVYSFFEKQKQYLNRHPLVLAHGDFVLKNILAHKTKLYVIDWELARLDNLAADLARMWVQPFKYPAWQKELILTFLKKIPKKKVDDFKELFRITAMVESLGEFACSIWSVKKTTKRQKAYKYKVQKALKGFNQLINLKL